MFRIAVCDDDRYVLDQVNVVLSDYLNSKHLEFEIKEYFDGNDLLKTHDSYDIVFLDIEMKHSNGINVAECIRDKNMNVPIVYITSYTDYWRRAFKVHAFGFITKPFNKSEFEDVLDDFFLSLKNSSHRITFVTSEGTLCFEYEDILYFYSKSKRNVEIIVKNNNDLKKPVLKYIIRENLYNIYDKLDKRWFYQTRRECIINLRNVKSFNSEYTIMLVDGTILPLAQRKKDDFMHKLSDAFTYVLSEHR